MDVTTENELCSLASQTTLREIPRPTVEKARLLLLDGVAVAVAGSGSTLSARMLHAATRSHPGDEAVVPGGGVRLAAEGAALMAAHNMHCLEYDAIHEAAVVHPVSVVLPCLLADIQRQKAETSRVTTGQEFLQALIVGVEVAARLGVAATSGLRFFRPGTAGILAGVAAMCHMRGLAPDEMRNAMGIAYGQLSGTMQPHTEGVPLLAAQVGFNARNAVHALALHDAGLEGPAQFLSGPFGYFGLIESAGDLGAVTQGWGRDWAIDATSIKPYPTGRATHGGIDVALAARRQAQGRRVLTVEVEAPAMILHLVGREPRRTMPTNYARLCLKAAMAMALTRPTIGLEDFPDEVVLTDAELAIASAIELTATDNPDPNAFMPQRYRFGLDDGTEIVQEVSHSRGSPESALSFSEVAEKAVGCLAAGRHAMNTQDAQKVVGLITGIEEMADACVLLEPWQE